MKVLRIIKHEEYRVNYYLTREQCRFQVSLILTGAMVFLLASADTIFAGFIQLDGIADVKLTEENGLTILNYEVDVNVGGKVAQLGSRLINGVAKKMSDYFFGQFSDLVAPIKAEKKDTGEVVIKKRVKELKSNFLNKYVYSIILVLILLLVAIIYFVSR